MTVAIIVPFRPDEAGHRTRSWELLKKRHEAAGRPVVEGSCGDGAWCKAEAVRDALRRTEADTLVIHDADVWCDELDVAIVHVLENPDIRWAMPHDKVYRLAVGEMSEGPKATLEQRPYRGWAGGGITVIGRSTYGHCPLDHRFIGWGQEDASWATALATLYGAPWRGDAPLWHWWHEPQARKSRSIGSMAGAQLHRRYKQADRDRQAMEKLLEEVRTSC